MKRILTSLIFIVSLMAACPLSSSAQKNKKDSEQILMMKSDASQPVTGHKFVIDGHVALDIPDSCYNIYITDLDKEITSSDLVACVPVKNKQFRIETDLSTMKSGRIRAIMPGGNLCSAWIDLFFIPGFTIDMTVHNGYYDLHNKSEYNFMTNAWLNKDAMGVLCNSLGIVSTPQNAVEDSSIEKAISVYQDLLLELSDQLKQVQHINYVPSTFIQEETKRILDQMEKINLKMQELIDKYADSLKF